jgi:WhiB family redox-sensing transcriptional regulator
MARDFRDEGLCAQTDPEAFFPEKGASIRAAKLVCSRCPIRVECLTDALDRGERYGVWGGLSERERRELERGRVA